jgi:hypothetical protein
MKRGEWHFTGGCVEGANGSRGCCFLCGYDYEEENCCGSVAVCPCMALATSWEDVHYRNVILLITHWLGIPYGYFWERWYS